MIVSPSLNSNTFAMVVILAADSIISI